MRRARSVLAVCFALALSSTHVRADAPSFSKELQAAAELIESLHLDEAERALAKLDAAHPDAPAVLYQRSMLAFHQGDYVGAAELSQQAVNLTADEHKAEAWRGMHELQQATANLTQSYVHQSAGDGRYAIWFPDGEDRVLVPYALATLATMDATLASMFGQRVPGPIRLEIYPSAEALAQVSTLTLSQIETSGTVALCKWNRLMVTSPRALVRGYPWADTIAHELTHLYLTFVTGDKAPVWLQEGTAKMLERRWRDTAAPFALDPASRALLERATRDNKLLSFDRLHPSIALLPSQDDASLAFAQVSTFMDRFVTTHGQQALRDAFAQVAQGKDAREALAKAADTRFSDLEKSWRASLPKAAAEKAPRQLARRFRSGHDQAPDESGDVAGTDARKFLRLGDLLWSRQHVRGAMLEYQKAHDSERDDPIIGARLARAALQAGDPARSLAAVEPLLSRYPEHAPTHAVAGAALVALGRNAEARVELIEAIRINPFDPEPHCALSRLDAGDHVEQSACALLRQP